MFEIDVVSNQLSFGLSPFPVIVENKGLAWEPLLKNEKCTNPGGDYYLVGYHWLGSVIFASTC